MRSSHRICRLHCSERLDLFLTMQAMIALPPAGMARLQYRSASAVQSRRIWRSSAVAFVASNINASAANNLIGAMRGKQ